MAAELPSRPAEIDHRRLLLGQVRIPRHVVYRDFPAEMVILNLETDRYHSLNPTAGRMLVALDVEDSVAAAAKRIADHYHRPRSVVQRDICELCDKLLDRGLIELVEDAAD